LNGISDAEISKERNKLRKTPLVQIIAYIAQSIDIIINMKNEELESNALEGQAQSSARLHGEPIPTVTSIGSVESNNLIMQSMREALKSMNEKAKR
jgi:hypothetical protein